MIFAACCWLTCSLHAQDEPLPNPFELTPSENNAPPTDEPQNAEVSTDDPATEAELERAEEEPGNAQAQGGEGDKEDKGDNVLAAKYQQAYVIEANGPIFGRFHWYLNQQLDLAEKGGADLVIIKLTSPGGDLEMSLQLARRLRDIDWATTVAYVPDEAISGGAIIALGCDRIYMEDGALIGDAGPIQMGLDGQFQHAEEKVLSFLVSAVRELAISKGRPPAVAEAMVDRSVVLYTAVNRKTGQETVLTEAETKAADAAALYDIGKVVAESGQNRFLTVGAARAKDLHLCEGVFLNERELLQRLDVKQIKVMQITWVDKFVYVLNRPWLTVLLLLIGLIGLYLEMAAPGLSVAGLVSLLCFGIFFWSHALGGTSGWLEVLLFLLGVICLGCEIFVLPGFGVFGFSGLALIGVSLVMASQDFVVPNDAVQWGVLQQNVVMVLSVLLGVILLGFLQVVLLDSIPGLNRFRLAAPSVDSDVDVQAQSLAAAGPSSQLAITIGAKGTADSDLRPSGKVMLDGRLIDVVTEGDYVDAGSSVEVIKMEGMRVVVRRVVG